MYLGTYYGLNQYNNKFKLLNFDKKLYVVKNLVKSSILAIITFFGTPYFYTSLIESVFDNELIYKFGALYVSNDIIALCVVKNLSITTKCHHFITTLLLFYSYSIDFNDSEKPGILMYIYTISISGNGNISFPPLLRNFFSFLIIKSLKCQGKTNK